MFFSCYEAAGVRLLYRLSGDECGWCRKSEGQGYPATKDVTEDVTEDVIEDVTEKQGHCDGSKSAARQIYEAAKTKTTHEKTKTTQAATPQQQQKDESTKAERRVLWAQTNLRAHTYTERQSSCSEESDKLKTTSKYFVDAHCCKITAVKALV